MDPPRVCRRIPQTWHRRMGRGAPTALGTLLFIGGPRRWATKLEDHVGGPTTGVVRSANGRAIERRGSHRLHAFTPAGIRHWIPNSSGKPLGRMPASQQTDPCGCPMTVDRLSRPTRDCPEELPLQQHAGLAVVGHRAASGTPTRRPACTSGSPDPVGAPLSVGGLLTGWLASSAD
jgi:hypothetical protein